MPYERIRFNTSSLPIKANTASTLGVLPYRRQRGAKAYRVCHFDAFFVAERFEEVVDDFGVPVFQTFKAFGKAQHTGGGFVVPVFSARPLRQGFV